MSKGKPKKDGTASAAESKADRNARYERELERLQVELSHLQRWVKSTGARIILVFEGRDAAGKGGTIRRIVERVSPRVFRVVALPAPSDREKTQVFAQRYMQHLPSGGEVVIFDRSWYNRAGVERVMGFATDEQIERFLHEVPMFEQYLVRDGIILLKYFLTVSQDEQRKRFKRRIGDPVRQWKLSPMDIASYQRWWRYTEAYEEMLRRTDHPAAPWWIVPSDDKKAARINCISHLLSQIPYETIPFDAPQLGERDARPEGIPDTEVEGRRVVPSAF
ncbi:polyphosphate kinase 2 [Tautonia rosea]|uniref:polyphosphate kinase 2 n=1 Tax=Tautonia rosea TaxID=2728037 RepID=UPI0019D05A06|nr:polyphosphate kinase 2 [Tautonia rosea]